MNVNDFDKYISSYLDGDLKPSLMKEFEELLKNNPKCSKKLESYKAMLNELSNLEVLKTSEDFIEKVHQKINKPSKVTFMQQLDKVNFFGYDYISITGVAAAVAMFIFSISIFMNSNHTLMTEHQLSTKHIHDNPEIINNNQLLSEEDDSLRNNDSADIPIHLVGSKK